MEARDFSNSQTLPFELSLRIRHPSMDPADVTRELGVEPRHSFRAGHPRQARSGLVPASVHGDSYWLGTLDPTFGPADVWLSGAADPELAQKKFDKATARNLGWALAFVARRFVHAHTALFERLRAEGGQASLLVALSPVAVGSFSLAPEVSRLFSELGITVEFEMTSD